MHFSHLNNGAGKKATKIAVVAGLHVLVATVFINSINTRHITVPKVPEDIMVMLKPEMPPPPPPPEPPKPMPKVAPPDLVVPKVEVETPPPQEPPPMQATTEPDPTPAEPAAQPAEAPPAQPSENTGAMRTAVMADGCTTPQYPSSSLRNGDTGTTTLALLIGPDGRVQQSRVEHSSGHSELDRAAVRALSLCKFKPAMNNGQAEAGWAQLAFDWKLE